MSDGIPPLRDDIEVQYRPNGTVDVRDPHLLQIYTLDAEDFSIAKCFDGTAPEDVARKLKSQRRGVTPKRVRQVANDFDDLRLLDKPEVWEEEPNVDNVSPYSQLDTRRGLKVLPIADSEARWDCHGCGVCCHGLAVEISPEEEARIDARLYTDLLDGQPFAEDTFLNADEPAKRTLRQLHDRNMACVFLSPEGLCHVHARQGMEAKPDACQIFPAMVLMVPGEKPRVGLRTNCSSMYKSFQDGPLVSELVPHVMRIVKDQGEVHKAPKTLRMFKRSVPFARLDRVTKGMRAMFEANGVSAETVFLIDTKYLGGRVRKCMRRYGKAMLAYMYEEEHGPVPVEDGAYRHQVRRLRRGREALEMLEKGRSPPAPRAKLDAFLRAQLGHILYIGAPLNLPDAGYALVGQMLALLAILHAVAGSSALKTANTAFEVFMMPLLETMEHSWPILDAIDPKYADVLREEVA